MIAHSIARAMSATSISGRHGDPSLSTVIFPSAIAPATKSFSTRSSRSRGLAPHAVAKRRHVTVMPPLLAERSPSSVAILLRAYAVSGLTASRSERAPPSAKPYTLHDDANAKCFTPASRASIAQRTEARWLMSSVTASNRLPIGSFDTAARCTTASTPSNSSGPMSRTSPKICRSSRRSGNCTAWVSDCAKNAAS